jgi:large subunit ribosomal protein L23
MIQIIKRPIITEKASKMQASRQYCFEVTPDANKIQIKQALEQLFEVNIISVRTTLIKGKVKRRMTKKGLMVGRKPLRKKAYITLKQGQTLDIVSGEAEGND